MKIPVDIVREMKRKYKDADEMWLLASAVPLKGSPELYGRMWEGDFGDIDLSIIEGFWFMVGYTVELKRMER